MPFKVRSMPFQVGKRALSELLEPVSPDSTIGTRKVPPIQVPGILGLLLMPLPILTNLIFSGEIP